MPPSRGDLYFIEIPQEYRGEKEDFGPHMHVVVSRNEVNRQGDIVQVVPLTSPNSKVTGQPKDSGSYRLSRMRIPADQKIWDDEAPHRQTGDSIAKTEQVFCLSQSYLKGVKRCGKVTDIALNAIEAGLVYVFNFPNLGRSRAALNNPNKPLQPPVSFKPQQ